MNAIGIGLYTNPWIDNLITWIMASVTSTLAGPESWTHSKNEMSSTLIGQQRSKENEASFLKALEDHQWLIRSICHLYCNHRSDQKDLFQEIVFQLWKAYPSFENKSSVSTWMYSIAIHTAAEPYKRRRAEVEFAEIVPDVPVEEEDKSHDHDEFLKFFRSLDKIDRAIVALMMENYSRTEIGTLVGLREEAVSMRVSRLSRKLSGGG